MAGAPGGRYPGGSGAVVGGELGLLAVAVGSLAVGPILAWAWPAGRAWRAFLDGLSLSLVGGLCLLHLGPHAVAEGGLAALTAGAIGFLGPALLHRASGAGARVWAVGGALAVLVHSAIDGAALAVAGDAGRAVAIAVAAHQVPVGLGIWALAHRADGQDRAATGWVAIAAAMAATGLGYVTGEQVLAALPALAESSLEALVAGALLHVVFDAAGEHDHAHDPPPRTSGPPLVLSPVGDPHRFVRVVGPPRPLAPAHGHRHCQAHDHDHGHDTAALRAWSSVGAVLGAAVIGALSTGDGAVGHLAATARAFAALGIAGAPALLGGYLVAGLVAAAAAPEGPRAARGPAGQALAGVAFGLPLPVCACGVLPMYESLVRRGAPAISALAFLLATPALGPEAILLGIPLLGLPFSVARAAGAVAAATAVAVLVGHTLPVARAPSARAEAPEPAPPLRERLRDGLRFALVDLVDHTLPWVVLGLLLSALAEPLLAHDLLPAVSPVISVPTAAVLALPFHLSAAGAAPVVAIAVHKGVSPGAALAFVLAGPATGTSTFSALARLHGARVAVRYAFGVVGLAVLAGWAADLLGLPVAPVPHAAPAPGPVAVAASLALVGLGTASLFRQGARGVVGQILAPTHTRRASGR